MKLSLPRHDRYLLACSAGIDSMVLATLMHDAGYDVELAHVDHGWREEGKDEVDFIKEVFPFTVVHFHQLTGVGGEAQARSARYAFLHTVARETNRRIVTAHHADDIVETMIFFFMRGARLRALVGMSDPAIIRPLIPYTKQDISQYAERHGIAYRHDRTNDDVKYSRNFIRHVLIPTMKSVFPEVVTRLQSMRSHLAEVNDYITHSLTEWLKENCTDDGLVASMPASAFIGCHPFLQAEIIRHFAPAATTGQIKETLQQLKGRRRHRIMVKTVAIERNDDLIVIVRPDDPQKPAG